MSLLSGPTDRDIGIITTTGGLRSDAAQKWDQIVNAMHIENARYYNPTICARLDYEARAYGPPPPTTHDTLIDSAGQAHHYPYWVVKQPEPIGTHDGPPEFETLADAHHAGLTIYQNKHDRMDYRGFFAAIENLRPFVRQLSIYNNKPRHLWVGEHLDYRTVLIGNVRNQMGWLNNYLTLYTEISWQRYLTAARRAIDRFLDGRSNADGEVLE